MGDFNGDGFTDIVATNNSSNDLNLYFGNGQNSYQTETLDLGFRGRSTTVVDFQSDGILDLAVLPFFPTRNIRVLKGVGDGSFEYSRCFTTLGLPAALIAADLNNDGHVDVATANSDTDNVSILIAKEDGSLGNVGPRPRDIATGDFNGDGVTDLASVNDCLLYTSDAADE